MADRQSWIVAGEAFNTAVYGERYGEHAQVSATTHMQCTHAQCTHAIHTVEVF